MHPDIKVRRLQIDLRTNGIGFIYFAFWDIIEYIIRFIVAPEDYFAAYSSLLQDGSMVFKVVMITILLVTIGLITYFHIYIGRNAILQANGKKRSRLYIILAILGLTFSVSSSIWVYGSGMMKQASIEDLIACFINLASDAILLGVIIDAIRLKKYEVPSCN